MSPEAPPPPLRRQIVTPDAQVPDFAPGETVRVMTRSPIGHYRVPQYLRGKTGVIESVIRPMAVDNEEEAYGRNAGSKGHYFRVAFSMAAVWPGYVGRASDSLRIEIFHTWLEKP